MAECLPLVVALVGIVLVVTMDRAVVVNGAGGRNGERLHWH